MMKTSDKIKAGKKMPGRHHWHGMNPRTQIVKPKKGKGAYQRCTMRGLEREKISEARDFFRREIYARAFSEDRVNSVWVLNCLLHGAKTRIVVRLEADLCDTKQDSLFSRSV